MYLLIEGYGGSGKTSIKGFITEFLKSKGITQVASTYEPGVGNTSIREILLQDIEIKQIPRAQMFLFLADRTVHMHQCIRPWMDLGYSVIQDRGYISTLVYQGVEQYLGADYVYELHKQNELLNPYPDMVILVDADAETCFKRMEIRDQGKQHNYNRCSLDELKRRRGTYLDMAKKFVPEEKLWILDNNRPMQEVQAEIEERLIKLFNL